MARRYSKADREKKRVKFARHRKKSNSIEASCKVAGISTAAYYAWNPKGTEFLAKGGWGKNGWGK